MIDEKKILTMLTRQIVIVLRIAKFTTLPPAKKYSDLLSLYQMSHLFIIAFVFCLIID